jgi:ATP-dependent RNA helicase DeaD
LQQATAISEVSSVHATVAAPAADSNGFLELGLTESVVQALRDVGYEAPTPIQAATIPAILAGSDVLGQAQTGTGKTGAFALPILSKIDVNKPQTQAMVLVPTRELAIQVAEAFQRYATHMKGFHVLPIYGGQSYTPQLKGLKRGAHVIVGTPGRVMDHMKRGTLPLDAMTFLVLDEADEMLQMGFIDAIEWILEQSPPTRQIALFSATVPPAIRRIAQRHQRSPKEITIRSKTSTAPNIRQRYWIVSGMHKLDALTRILEAESFDAMLVFVRTKLETVELAERLEARGFEAAPLNGDIPQPQRERTIAALKSGKVDIVVATDVAARGLDVERISHVVNYDVPYDSESYIHRIGRTGRAGRSGEAILFIAPRERNMLRIIERATRQQLTQMNLPSVAAVNEHRVARFKQRIADTLADGETEAFRTIVEEFQAEHDVSAIDVAAALASLLQGSTPLLLPEKSESEQSARGGWGRRDDQRDGSRDRDRSGPPPSSRGRNDESRGQRGARGDSGSGAGGSVRAERGAGEYAGGDRAERGAGGERSGGGIDARGDRDNRATSGRQYGGGERGFTPDRGPDRGPNRGNESHQYGRGERPVRDERPVGQAEAEAGGGKVDAGHGHRDERLVVQAEAGGGKADAGHGHRDERPAVQAEARAGDAPAGHDGHRDERPAEQAGVEQVVIAQGGIDAAQSTGDVSNSGDATGGDLDAFTLERDAQEPSDGPVQFVDERAAGDGLEVRGGHAAAANVGSQSQDAAPAPRGDDQVNRLKQFADDRSASDGHNARPLRGARDRRSHGNQGNDAQGNPGANSGRGGQGGNVVSQADQGSGGGAQRDRGAVGENGAHGGGAQRDRGTIGEGGAHSGDAHSDRGAIDEGGANGGGAGSDSDAGARTARRGKRDDNNDVVFETFRLEVGHAHGVKPGNIVGAIANEAGLEGKHIGHVDIRDDHSFVDLPEGMPRDIFRNLKKVRVVGQELRISRVDAKPSRQH